MYTTMLANSYWFHPATSTQTGIRRAQRATLLVAVGAIVGWPFSAALGIPFVFEQLFLTGGEVATGDALTVLRSKRWDTMLKAVAVSACIAVSSLIACTIPEVIVTDSGVADRLLGLRAAYLPNAQHIAVQRLIQRQRTGIIRHFPVFLLLRQLIFEFQFPIPYGPAVATGIGGHLFLRSP